MLTSPTLRETHGVISSIPVRQINSGAHWSISVHGSVVHFIKVGVDDSRVSLFLPNRILVSGKYPHSEVTDASLRLEES